VSLVVFERVSLGFGKKRLVEGLDLRIGRGDRIGLVGPNGSGKSSILKLIAGQLGPDGGAVRLQKHVRVGYLPQDLPQTTDKTVLDTVLQSVPGRAALHKECEEAEAEHAAAGDDEERMMEAAESIADVHERLASFDRFYSEHEAHRILTGLGFADGAERRPMAELSGGWQMRAMLSALLFQRPELLMLDEPTNHLDLPTVAWFGNFLRGYPHGFVLICHDRDFLSEQIGRVVSLEPEGVRQFRGNYEEYVKQRAEEEIVLENQARNLQREREKAEQFIERFRAQANKAKAVQSRIKQLEKLGSVQTFERRKVMRFRFPPCERAGDIVLKTEGLAQAFGDRRVFDGVNLHVARGEKIGIIGVNGAGKTTLLRTIAGEIEPKAGTIDLGHKVKLGYYAQHHADALDSSATVFEEVAARNRGAGETAVRSLLGAFLFSDDDVDKPVKVLSGGERARVALARMLIDPGNLVLMDEPTNHLDLESSESLAESLRTFDGTLIFVSHNRSFVRRLATRIWSAEAGTVETYPGTLEEYIARHRGDRVEAPAEAKPSRGEAKVERAPEPKAPRAAETKAERRARRRQEAEQRGERNRRLGPVRKRIAELEAQIETLETAQRERNLQLADPAVYDDAARRSQLLGDYQRDAAALAECTEAWELAQQELEELEK
jgi:ATP-binding cassette subfamily F protein 3